VLVCLAGLPVCAARAWAHAVLERSVPADGAQLDRAPAQVDLYFAETLVQNRSGTFAVVYDPTGGTVSSEARIDSRDGKHLVVPLRSGLDADTYEVFWKTTSDEDGGVTLGNFSFSVGSAPAPAATRPAGGQVLVPDDAQIRTLSHAVQGGGASAGRVAVAAVTGVAAGLLAGCVATWLLMRHRSVTPPASSPARPRRR